MQKSFFAILIIVALAITIAYSFGSCRKDYVRNPELLLPQVIPDGFPLPEYRFENNTLTKKGFELGRKLFYDGILSLDGNFPCASCHQQKAGFGTFEHDLSHGYGGSHTLRNAPVLFNLAWQKNFHWDGAFSSLEEEAVQPITSHIDMAETFQGVINKLQQDGEYRKMFKEIYKSPVIRLEHIVKALAQFTGYMTSADSKYDRYKKGIATYTISEENGYLVYKAKCATCHAEPLFTDYSFRNIGLPIDNLLKDFGRMMVTGKKEDSLKFKVPTLRNVNISSNYMHDGRFNTLAQCINHYRTGVQHSPSLDPLLSGGIQLTNTEDSDLFVFLKTLTDSAFLTDTRYSKPN